MSSCSTGSSGTTGLIRIWRSNNSSWMRSWSGPPMWAHRGYRAWWLYSKAGEFQFWLFNVVVGPTQQLPMAMWSQATSPVRGGSWGCVHALLKMLLGMMQITSNLGSEMPTTELTWRRLEPRFQQHGSQWAISLDPTWSLLYRQFAGEELEWRGQSRLNSSVSWPRFTRTGGPTQWQVCQLRWGQRSSSSELLMPATSTSRALQGSTLRSQRSCRRSRWPLYTMIDRWRSQLLKDLQLLLHKPGSRRPKIAKENVIKLEKMRRGSKTEQVVSSTPGIWTGSLWQMLMREFVDMWWPARSQLHEIFGQHHTCSVRWPARQEEVQWDDGSGWRDPGGRSSAEAEIKFSSCNKCSHQCHGSSSSRYSSRYSGICWSTSVVRTGGRL